MEKTISGDVVCREWNIKSASILLSSDPQSAMYLFPVIAIEDSSIYFYFLTYSLEITL